MNKLPLQPTSLEAWDMKYRLKDNNNHPIDLTVEDTFNRIATAMAAIEKEDQEHWKQEFLWAMNNGATPAGRIMSNAGAEKYKPSTSTINCTVSGTIPDSMEGILDRVKEAGLTLKAGCGIGYEFSTLRPRGAFVRGAGASTSGPLTFMDIYDSMCFTVSSAGGRRGEMSASS
jgi:ribonucleoside-diphosphate reductase alpha chain